MAWGEQSVKQTVITRCDALRCAPVLDLRYVSRILDLTSSAVDFRRVT